MSYKDELIYQFKTHQIPKLVIEKISESIIELI